MKNYLLKIGFTILFCGLLGACQLSVSQNRHPTSPSPSPPPALKNLPRNGEVRCETSPEFINNPIAVWRHAARFPLDLSDSNPDRGGEVGVVKYCQEIVVLDYEWSAYYQEFWMLIETPEGVHGWLSEEDVELNN